MAPISLTAATALPPPSKHPLRDALGATEHWLFGDKGLSFRDLLDIVNPLQHIPGVSQLYRKLTGDEIKPSMELAGGALFGGPIGVALSALGLIAEAGIKQLETPSPATAAGSSTALAEAGNSPSARLLAYRQLTKILAAAPGTAGRRDAGTLAAAYTQLENQRLRGNLHETA
jgi:hypothetical protein